MLSFAVARCKRAIFVINEHLAAVGKHEWEQGN